MSAPGVSGPGGVWSGVSDLGDVCSQGGLVPGGSGPGGVRGGDPPDGYCCGRYTSYWNAFLLLLNSLISVKTFRKNSIVML